jgi:hypothetical protein
VAPTEIDEVSDADWDAYADQYEAEWEADADARYIRVRPAFRNGWRKPYVATNGRLAGETGYEASLPEFLI